MATIETPVVLYWENVLPAWIDDNGHMTAAAYLAAFTTAGDAFLDYIGLSAKQMAATGFTSFALSSKTSFLRETFEGVPLRFETRLVDLSDKVFHHATAMIDETDGQLLAVTEYLEACVSAETRRIANMPEARHRYLTAMLVAHNVLPDLPGVGEAIAVRH
ncbi:MAG: thioesterase family protein [Pseudomonadota bacterium]|nr:thioesterase family protein [Pseudomonadota bacterium]